MNLNYDFSDTVWWRPEFYSYTNKGLINHIKKYIRISKEFIANENNAWYIDDFEKEYRIIYLRECLIGEGNIPASCSFEYIENVLQDKVLIDTNDKKQMREVKKIKNMHQAIHRVFPNMILPDFDINLFDSSLSNSIHSIIGYELIDFPGLYRQLDAKPSGENFFYLPYEQIPSEMEKLFQITKSEMEKIFHIDDQEIYEEQIEQVIKVAGHFLNRFLYIHPYANGNGRTARILISYLLSKISVVPVSLTEGARKEIYLDCLRELSYSVRRIEQPPIALATLLLERVFLSLEFFYKTIIDN